MVIVFSAILLGTLFLFRPLQRNNFYLIHSAIVILSAYIIENKFFTVNPFNPKILLLFLVFHFVSINIVTVLAYYVDKRAAKKGQWRVSESNLHMLEFLGGWIGAAIFGQMIMKHKTKKRQYRAAFMVLGVVQAVMIIIICRALGII